MIKKTMVLFLLLSVNQAFSQEDHDVVNEVVEKLAEQFSNSEYIVPQVKIVDKNSIVATYFPKKETIEISEKTISICKDFGDRYEDALAFILGHELAHSVQENIHRNGIETNFLAYDKHNRARKHLEENADLNGAFASYLAGYRVDDIIPKVLGNLYEAYGLKGKKLSGYPTFESRIMTSSNMSDHVTKLISLYDLSTYLSITERYEYTIPLYEEIMKSYNGVEVINNKAASLALMAMNIGDYNLDQYIYPFEFFFESRLQKKIIDKRSKDIPIHIIRKRNEYLKQAKSELEKVIERPGISSKVLVNYYSILNMLGHSQFVIDKLKDKEDLDEKLKLILALSYLNLGNEKYNKEGSLILHQLNKSKDLKVRSLAEINKTRIDCEDKEYTKFKNSGYAMSSTSADQDFSKLEFVGNSDQLGIIDQVQGKQNIVNLHLGDSNISMKIVKTEIDPSFVKKTSKAHPYIPNVYENKNGTYYVVKSGAVILID